VFAAIVNATVALAVPLAPDEIVIQLAAVDAVQLQPLSVVTSTDKRPPPAPIVSALRLIAK